MKKPLNLRRFVPVALLLVLAVICGSVFAYMFHRTEDETASFIPAQVSCEVDEKFDGTTKSDITVTNTSNINAYLRVRLVTYWVTGDGKVAAKDSPELTFSPADDWIAGSKNTASDKTFYYPIPVAPNKATPELFSGPITLAEGQVIDVFAEAIQALPTNAVESTWGVTLSGTTITAAP